MENKVRCKIYKSAKCWFKSTINNFNKRLSENRRLICAFYFDDLSGPLWKRI